MIASRRRSAQSSARLRREGNAPRAGFTLVELIVTILVLSIGILGLAGTAALITRQMGGAARMTIAAGVARDRFEALRAVNCGTLGGATGSGTTRGISESWSVAWGTRNASLNVTTTVTWPNGRGGTRSRTFTTVIPCAIAS